MREFKVGDIVHIVDYPINIHPGWQPNMNKCCGEEVEITFYHADLNYFRVKSTNQHSDIDFDWVWDAKAFQEFYEDELRCKIEPTEIMNLLEVV